MVTRKITFQQSQEIEKERGCGLIEKIELSGIGVSGEIWDILLNEAPTVPGKYSFPTLKIEPHLQPQGSKAGKSEVNCEQNRAPNLDGCLLCLHLLSHEACWKEALVVKVGDK